MKQIPKPGEVWFADLGYAGKPRWTFVISNPGDGRLAVASVVLVTTQHSGTPYEITLPRVPWLSEQSYVNAQSIQPVKVTEFTHPARGKFDERIFKEVKAAVKLWLAL